MELRYRLAKLILAAGVLLLFALPSLGQVSPSPFVVPQYFDNSGHACAGCKLASFAAGTSTPLATFSDPSGVFPNANPTILDSAGRARIYLTGASYKLVLSTAAGTQIWSVDQVAGSSNSLLSQNNVWTGTNTWQATSNFNAPVNFNVGLTSLGPNVLNGGGTIAGTWSGSPTFTGTVTFAGQVNAVNIVYSGELFSTIVTGTPPMSVVSTTQVPNFNASLLEGCTWESPCSIGGVTPNTAHFTAIVDTGLFTLGGSNVSSIKGTDPALYTAGTIAGGAGNSLCTDANGSATTTGCALSGITKIQTIAKGGNCTTTGGSFDNCNDTLTWPTAFADTSYNITCSGENPVTGGVSDVAATLNVISHSTTQVVVQTQTQRSESASYTTIYCNGAHP